MGGPDVFHELKNAMHRQEKQQQPRQVPVHVQPRQVQQPADLALRTELANATARASRLQGQLHRSVAAEKARKDSHDDAVRKHNKDIDVLQTELATYLPKDWTATIDPNSHRIYYQGPFPMGTQWEKPASINAAGSSAALSALSKEINQALEQYKGKVSRRLATVESQTGDAGYSLALLLLWVLIGTIVGSIVTFAMLRHLSKPTRERQPSWLHHYSQHRHDPLQHYERLL